MRYPNNFPHLRSFMKSSFGADHPVSDQKNGADQPPLFFAPETTGSIKLTTCFTHLDFNELNYYTLLKNRRSIRQFNEQPMSFDALSFILWSTQGIAEYTQEHTRTRRPVPSAGARHGFETYVFVNKVVGLSQGLYLYRPQFNDLALVRIIDNYESTLFEHLRGQRWAESSSVTLYWVADAYRGEWRYSNQAQKLLLIDLGCIVQDTYLSVAALGLGTTTIGGYLQTETDAFLQVDGVNQFCVLAQPIGSI